MRHKTTIQITEPDDRVAVRMGGTRGEIPVIEFGEPFSYGPELVLNELLLSPDEQVAWLERLSAAVLDLAGQVRERAALDGAA